MRNQFSSRKPQTDVGVVVLRRMLMAAAVCSSIGGMSGVSHAQTCQQAGPTQPELIIDAAGDLVPNTKNRFLSFSAGDPGRQQAVRIVFTALPAPYDIWNGGAMWVGQPVAISENNGCIEPVGPCAAFPTFMAAGLGCDVPFFMDWSTVGTIHIHHEGIIPGATYTVQVLDSTCDPTTEADYSPARTMTTSRWGDVTGGFDSTAGVWTAADGSVDLSNDQTAVGQNFGGQATAPSKTRVDLVPRVISLTTEISDVIAVQNAFSGASYPFAPDGPLTCINGGNPLACGNQVIDLGEQCDDGNTTPGDGCSASCLIEASAVLALMPRSADGSHTTNGNSIDLFGAGQRVTLDLMLSGWDPDLNGSPAVSSWQVTLDAAGFLTGNTGQLALAAQPCTGQLGECEAVFGGACSATGITCTTTADCLPAANEVCVGAECTVVLGTPNRCLPAFILSTRPDFVFSSSALNVIDVSTPNVRWGSTLPGAQSPAMDAGAPVYLGTLILNVPVGATGTFTVGVNTSGLKTSFTDSVGQNVPIAVHNVAAINIIPPVGCCDPIGACLTVESPAACASSGGTTVAACGMDDNGNSINDACEVAACCTGATCDVIPALDCLPQGGAFVCGCVTSACDTCDPSVTNAPLAEDGGLGTCIIDTDCAGASTCIGGTCYIPKNRYVSFQPTNPDACIAYRIDLTSSVTFPACTFATKWIGEPDPVTGVARVVDAPVYRNWTESVVHVGDSEIVPESTYELRAIQEACDPGVGTDFSAALVLPTGVWGDLVGQCTANGICTPPDGIANPDGSDFFAASQAWSGDTNVPTVLVDITPDVPDRGVFARDLLAALRASNGQPYPGTSPCAPSLNLFAGDVLSPGSAVFMAATCPPDPPAPSPTRMGCSLSGNTILPNGVVQVDLTLENMTDLVLFETTIGVCGVDDIADQTALVHLDCSGPNPGGGFIDKINRTDYVFRSEVGRSEEGKPRCKRTGQAYALVGIVPGLDAMPSGYLASHFLKVEPGASGQTFEVFITLNDDQNEGAEVSTLLQSVQATTDPSFSFEPLPISCGVLTIPFDCDENLVADDCDIDCNSTGLGAPCDPTTCGTRSDCNQNSIPDLCEIPVDSLNPGLFFCAVDCVGCPTTCVCSISGAPCNAGTCPVGDGDPLDVVSCDPDCNGNGTVDACEITVFDGGFCNTNPCLPDCQLDGIPDECNISTGDGGLCVGVDCSADCTPAGGSANSIPDECEADCDADGLPDACEPLVSEQDCDGDGECNALQIANCNGSPACGDCNGAGAGNGIPDICDIAVADGGLCTGASCSFDCQLPGDPGRGVPDECDVDPTDPDGDAFVSGDCDWNGLGPNGIPDECDIATCEFPTQVACADCNVNGIPDACDLSAGTSCDANGTFVPDTCEVQCAADRVGEDCNDFRFPLAGVDSPSIAAALRIVWLDGTVTDIENLSGSVAISHTDPHLHGDSADTVVNGEPCVTPPGFPEDSSFGHEVHLSMVALSLTNGADDLALGVNDTLGEAQGTCVDFPADAFFDLFVTLTVGAPPAPLPTFLAISNHTPIVVRAALDRDLANIPNFDWSFPTEGSLFLSDHTSPAIPLMDATGVHRAYLVRAQIGSGQLPPNTDSCDLSRDSSGAFVVGTAGAVSFAVASATDGVVIDPPSTNSVNDDAGFTRQQVRIYVSSGASAGAAPDTTNLTDAILTGTAPGDFISGDTIEGLSFGRDGTRSAVLTDRNRLLYFSVSRTSSGRACDDVIDATGVSTEASQGEAGADIYISKLAADFGDYEANGEAWPCHTARGNCLAVEQTALGLGPLAVGIGGALDDVTALERGRFATGNRAYLAFSGPSFEGLAGMPPERVPTSVFVYDDSVSFTASSMTPYVQLGAETGGLGVLQSGDVIDALAVSDVGAAGALTPDGVWSGGDEVLFSLAPGSPSLGSPLSAADVFVVRFGNAAALSVSHRFRSAAQLGLLVSDDIDAIDVGAGKIEIDGPAVGPLEPGPDCNNNAISDQCDIDRNLSLDVNPLDGIPDECVPPCPAVASRAIAEDGRPCVNDFDCTDTATCRDTDGNGTPDTCYVSKIRFLSFSAGDAGRMQAIRITFKQLPPQFAYAVGRSMWVGNVLVEGETPGKKLKDGCEPANEGCFTVARMRCTPLYRDWSSVGVMHVFGTELVASSPEVPGGPAVPGGSVTEAIYEIQVIDELPCNINNPTDFSPPLLLGMSRWGDVVREFIGDRWGPPSGLTTDIDIIDVVAIIQKFGTIPSIPLPKIRAEVSPNNVDVQINVDDFGAVIRAFGDPVYPFSGPPSQDACPSQNRIR